MTVYGIANCDTTQKLLKYLKQKGIEYIFHDYKLQGITEYILKNWCKQVGWETILNKRSTTWRELTLTEQKTIVTEKAAIQLMLAANSIIKRPIIEKDKKIIAVGFNEQQLNTLF